MRIHCKMRIENRKHYVKMICQSRQRMRITFFLTVQRFDEKVKLRTVIYDRSVKWKIQNFLFAFVSTLSLILDSFVPSTCHQ